LVLCTTVFSSVLLPIVTWGELSIALILAGVGPFVALYVVSLVLVRQGRSNAAALLYIWGTCVLQLVVLLSASAFQTQAFISFVNLMLCAGYMKGGRHALTVGVFSMFAVVLSHVITGMGLVPVPVVPWPPAAMLVSVLCTLAATCGLTYLGSRFASVALMRARVSQARAEEVVAVLEGASKADADRVIRAERLATMARAVVALRETPQIAREVAAALADVLPDLTFLLIDVRGQVLTVSGADWSAEGARLPWACEDVQEVAERSLSAEELAKLTQILQEPQPAGRLFAGSQSPVSMVAVGPEEAVSRLGTDWQVNAAWHVLTTGVHRIQVENALAQSQRMDALGRLSAGIAHDFNNLLTSILGGAELAANRVKGDATAEKYIADLRAAAQRAAGLTAKLMAFTTSATEGPRVIEVVGLVSGILPVLRRSVEERIEIVVAVPDQEVWVLADSLELERALLNLVVNARDAIAGTGEIEIGVEIRPVVGAKPPTDGVVIWVADTGAGIPAELQGKVFEPFFTTRRERGATGLGLSIVYGVVQSMGGEIILSSEPLDGTRIEILLAQQPPGLSEAPLDPVASTVPSGRCILVVEDDPDVRETVCEMLAVGGYTVCTAENGVAALQALETSGPFSLVLSDVVMPQMGGFELARRIAGRSDSPPIALVSGYAPTAQPGEEALMIPMIAKPFTLKRLLAFVEDLAEA